MCVFASGRGLGVVRVESLVVECRFVVRGEWVMGTGAASRLTTYTTHPPILLDAPLTPTPPQIPHTGRAAFGVVARNGEQCGNLDCAVVAFETRYVGERSVCGACAERVRSKGYRNG